MKVDINSIDFEELEEIFDPLLPGKVGKTKKTKFKDETVIKRESAGKRRKLENRKRRRREKYGIENKPEIETTANGD